nr:hypothetical protein 9 [Deltaproteobacteria bacterium]
MEQGLIVVASKGRAGLRVKSAQVFTIEEFKKRADTMSRYMYVYLLEPGIKGMLLLRKGKIKEKFPELVDSKFYHSRY